MKTTYIPKPENTDAIQLSAELNDLLKQHPCLVPYEQLPEEEKAYDRDTALGTLKLITKLGFKIMKE